MRYLILLLALTAGCAARTQDIHVEVSNLCLKVVVDYSTTHEECDE